MPTRTVRAAPTALELALAKATASSEGSHLRHTVKKNLHRVEFTRKTRVSKEKK